SVTGERSTRQADDLARPALLLDDLARDDAESGAAGERLEVERPAAARPERLEAARDRVGVGDEAGVRRGAARGEPGADDERAAPGDAAHLREGEEHVLLLEEIEDVGRDDAVEALVAEGEPHRRRADERRRSLGLGREAHVRAAEDPAREIDSEHGARVVRAPRDGREERARADADLEDLLAGPRIEELERALLGDALVALAVLDAVAELVVVGLDLAREDGARVLVGDGAPPPAPPRGARPAGERVEGVDPLEAPDEVERVVRPDDVARGREEVLLALARVEQDVDLVARLHLRDREVY